MTLTDTHYHLPETEQAAEPELFAGLYPIHKGTLFEGNHDLCELAQEFLAVCHELYTHAQAQCARVIGRPQAAEKLRETALRLLRDIEFRLYRLCLDLIRSAPRKCKKRGLQYTKHCCVWAVFETYQNQLVRMQQSFAGSVLDLPEQEPEAAAQAQQFVGIPLTGYGNDVKMSPA